MHDISLNMIEENSPIEAWVETKETDRAPPRLLASSEPTDCRCPSCQRPEENPSRFPSKSPNIFRAAQWSADGTTIITTGWDHTLAAYVLPEDLLDPDSECRSLHPTSITKMQEPIRSLALNPNFSLLEPLSQTALVTSSEHPIQLHHLFPHENVSRLASYPLINPTTEEFIAPTSVIWPTPGHYFICGSKSRIDVLDASREGGDAHLTTISTAPKGDGDGVPIKCRKGMVSALAAAPQGGSGSTLLAAGSWSRWVGLYDYMRYPAAVSSWALGKNGGRGVVQILWSPCGRYLIINERFSNEILVYDIRGGGEQLCSLGPRNNERQLTLKCDVFATEAEASESGAFEVWGGTQDGTVKVWENGGKREASGRGSWEWQAHQSAVANTCLHPSGSVVATSAGARNPPSDEAVNASVGKRTEGGMSTIVPYETSEDTSLRIWSIS